MGRKLPVAALCVALFATEASAGGLFLHTRGVRPTARAGAFVAGADDLSALWFNPAGLISAVSDGKQRKRFLFDVAYVDQSSRYRRIDSGNNQQESVSDSALGKPIPTIAFGFRVNDKLAIGGGVFAPYGSVATYPETGPQRYSLIDTSETAGVIVELAVAYKLSDRLRIGAGVQNLMFQVSSTIVFSGCPQEVTCAPEDPEFDSVNKISQFDAFSPSGVVGVQLDLGSKATAGLSFQFPFSISATGEFQARLPSSGFYDGATLVGDRADLSFTLPPVLRAGLELKPSATMRVEIAGSVEFWSVHDKYTIEPRNVRIENTPGLGTYEFSTVEIVRNFQNSYSVAIGGELKPSLASPLTLRAGYAYETSAVTDEYLSVITIDGAKHMFSGGIGYQFGKWRADVTAGFVKVGDRTVSPSVGIAEQLTPLRDPDGVPTLETYVNWGDYSSSWLIIGAGVSAAF